MGQCHDLFFFVWNFTENLRFSSQRPHIFFFLFWRTFEILWKTYDFCAKTFFEIVFWEHLHVVFLVLGLEYSCPRPREDLSSESWSLALAPDFFLALASSLVSLTSPLLFVVFITSYGISKHTIKIPGMVTNKHLSKLNHLLLNIKYYLWHLVTPHYSQQAWVCKNFSLKNTMFDEEGDRILL